ncbi:AsmA family protein [Nioella nitratireducens]|uniref:AsmA family protein n=1 Tax=Nioella nitratireducens TaxID=1287720 RepID=UPI0008FD1259|nr:AsmA family protein [Nioella nitratireducens]
MRWIVRGIVLLVVLVAVAVGGLFLIPADRIGAIVSDQFTRATGRTLVIGGDIRPSIYPTLGVRAEDIEMGNPDWVSDGPLLRAERLDVGVDLWALISGTVRVQQFELVRPDIILVAGADGRVSWDFSDGTIDEAVDETAPETPAAGGGLGAISLDLAEIRDATLLYRDEAAGTEVRVSAVSLSLSLPSADGPARLDGQGAMNGQTISVEAAIDGVGPMLAGELRPVVVSLGWDGGEAGFEGRAGLSPLGVEGTVALDATDLGPLMGVAGQAAPDLPQGLGHERIAVNGDFTLASEGTMHLRNGRFTFDDNALTGDIDILPGTDRPTIRARLAGGSLNLSALSEGGESTGSGNSADSGWSTDPIDASGLSAVDAEAALTLSGLDLGMVRFGTIDLRAVLDAGRLVLDLRQAAAYDGSITGQYIVNGRSGLSMRANLAVEGVGLAPLLTDFADYDRLQGTGDARFDVLMVGNSLNALMHSLEGSGSVEFGQGAILGLDIGGMIRNLDTSYRGEGQRTVYDSITASFDLAGGVVSNDDLLMTAPFGELTGSGTVGVGEQVLDYTVIPSAIYNAENQAGLRVPLRISGPWASPRFALDLEALANERVQEEVDALQQRATDAAAEALGIQQQEGQSLEDAAQDTLEDRLRQEAEDQLQRLLGGGN